MTTHSIPGVGPLVVLVVHGTTAEVAEAKEILAATQIAPHAAHELADQPDPSDLVPAGASKRTN